MFVPVQIWLVCSVRSNFSTLVLKSSLRSLIWDAWADSLSCADSCCWVVVGAYCHSSSLLHTAFLLSWVFCCLHWRLADCTKIGFWTRKLQFLEGRICRTKSWKTYLGHVALFSHIWKCLSVRGETKTTLSLPGVVRAKFPNEMWMARPLSVMLIANYLARLWF